MAISVNGTTIPQTKGQLVVNGVQLTKVNVVKDGTTTTVWEAGGAVTYYVDSGTTYSEQKAYGANCLSPSTFTPSKSGWTFIGWRENSTASSSVLSSKTMETSNIALYAVFRQTITLSYAGGGGSGSVTAQTGYRYYNNNNISNPSFTLSGNGFTRSGYTFTGWSLGAVGATVTLSTSSTATAQWLASTLTVFTAPGQIENNATLHNTTYIPSIDSVAYVGGFAQADYNHSESAYVNINYAGYKKCTITFKCDTTGHISWWETNRRGGRLIVDGATIYDNSYDGGPTCGDTYTITTTKSTLNFSAYGWKESAPNTYYATGLYVMSIVMSM